MSRDTPLASRVGHAALVPKACRISSLSLFYCLFLRHKSLKKKSQVFAHLCFTGIVHENVKMGSDGESDQASGTSSDEVQSPVRVRMRNNHHRRISNEV